MLSMRSISLSLTSWTKCRRSIIMGGSIASCVLMNELIYAGKTGDGVLGSFVQSFSGWRYIALVPPIAIFAAILLCALCLAIYLDYRAYRSLAIHQFLCCPVCFYPTGRQCTVCAECGRKSKPVEDRKLLVGLFGYIRAYRIVMLRCVRRLKH